MMTLDTRLPTPCLILSPEVLNQIPQLSFVDVILFTSTLDQEMKTAAPGSRWGLCLPF